MLSAFFFLRIKFKKAFPATKLFSLTTEDPGFSWQSEKIYHHVKPLFVFDEPGWKLRGREYLLINNLFPSKSLKSKPITWGPCIKKFWKNHLCLFPISGTQITASYRRTLKYWSSFSIPTALFLCPLISAFAPFMVLQLWLNKQKPVALHVLDLFLFFHHRPRALDMGHSHCSVLSVSSKTSWNMESESLPETPTPELKIPKCTGNF